MVVIDDRVRATGELLRIFSTATGHEAKWDTVGDDGWIVSWLPDRRLDTGQAEAALELTEVFCRGALRPKDQQQMGTYLDKVIEQAGLGLSIEEISRLASGRGPGQTGNRSTKAFPAVSPPPAPKPGPWRMPKAPDGSPVAQSESLTSAGAVAGSVLSEANDVIDGVTGRAAPDVIRDVMMAAAHELASIANEAEALRALFEAHSWAGLETVRSACELIASVCDVLVEIAEKIGVGGAIVRAACAARAEVGDKASLFDDFADCEAAIAGSAPATGDLAPVSAGEDEDRWAPVSGDLFAPASTTSPTNVGQTVTKADSTPSARTAPGRPSADAEGGVTAGLWTADGSARRCTAPLEGHWRSALCTTCNTWEDVDACRNLHEGDDTPIEWKVWLVDVGGKYDALSTKAKFGPRGGRYSSVEDVLDEADPLTVAREVSTGEVYTLDELLASYPETAEWFVHASR